MNGRVIGVASAGLSKLYMLETENYIPENVNFAVASPTLANFLKANQINIINKQLNISNTKELAKVGMPATAQLFCLNTKDAYEKLKKKKEYSDVISKELINFD